MIWNEERRKLLAKLKKRGLTNRLASREMSILCGFPISRISIENQLAHMRQSGWFLKYDEFLVLADRDIRGSQPRLEQTEDPIALRKGNLEHLLDLKRAGHSPARTEYEIAPDGHPRRYVSSSSATQSYCGSPSAMLASEA